MARNKLLEGFDGRYDCDHKWIVIHHYSEELCYFRKENNDRWTMPRFEISSSVDLEDYENDVEAFKYIFDDIQKQLVSNRANAVEFATNLGYDISGEKDRVLVIYRPFKMEIVDNKMTASMEIGMGTSAEGFVQVGHLEWTTEHAD